MNQRGFLRNATQEEKRTAIANTEFWCKIHKLMQSKNKDKDKGTVFSSYSIFSILNFALGGADGSTKQKIEKALKVNSKTIHNDIRIVQKMFNEKEEINLAQAIFCDMEPPGKILDSYFSFSQKFYYAHIKNTQFPDPGVKEINDYCKEKTKGLIPEVVKKNDCPKGTKIVLVNAIYFKAKWKNQFDKKLTMKKHDFSVFGKSMKVDMMTRRRSIKEKYGSFNIKGATFTACQLDYVGEEFGMIFVLPNKNSKSEMEKVEKTFTGDFITKIKRGIRMESLVELKIPKFEIESSFRIKEVLKKIGLSIMFDFKKANFQNMVQYKDRNFAFSAAIHIAKMIVDEEGTEAAAVTVMGGRGGGRPRMVEPKSFVADHPFFCFLVHNVSNTLLFSAKIIKPQPKK